MKRRNICVLGIVLTGLLLAAGCSSSSAGINTSSPVDATASTTRAAATSASTEAAAYSVDAASFTLTNESENLVMTGELTPFVSVHAQVICDRDLDKPGTGSVDQAIYKEFYPKDLDDLADPTWEVTSDKTVHGRYAWVPVCDQRTVNYILPDGRTVTMYNYFDLIYMSDNSISIDFVPEHIPWDSNPYRLGTEEFSFATKKDAFATLQNLVGPLGVTLSPLYSIDYITPESLDTVNRVMLAEGQDVPDKTWTDADSTYRIAATQDWNGLPIRSDEKAGFVFDGENLLGDAYHGTGSSHIDFMMNAQGVSFLSVYDVFECKSKGEEVELMSVWDALRALQTQINNPAYEREILYDDSIKKTQMEIDQIELCYLPVNLSTLNDENPGAGFTEGLTETEDGQPTFPFEMIPCWTFRLIYTSMFGSTEYLTCAVNATTGEYMLMTQNFPVI